MTFRTPSPAFKFVILDVENSCHKFLEMEHGMRTLLGLLPACANDDDLTTDIMVILTCIMTGGFAPGLA